MMPQPPLSHRSWITHRLHWRALARAAAAYGQTPILDVGCGAKPYRELFPPRAQYIGIDLPPALDIARLPQRRRAVAAAVDAHALATTMPFADSAFATVVCFQVLEHVVDPWALMRELGRVLRPGGHLILMAPQMWHTHEAPHDFFRYTRYGLAALARYGSMQPTSILALGGFPARVGLKVVGAIARAAALGAPAGMLAAPTAVLNVAFAAADTVLGNANDPINHLMVARRLPEPEP